MYIIIYNYIYISITIDACAYILGSTTPQNHHPSWEFGNCEKGKSWIGSFWAPILRLILVGFIVRKMGRAITYAYIYLYIYLYTSIYTPGPQRPPFLKFWPIKSGGKPTKIEVMWVPGIDMICVYTNYVCCYHVHPVIHWVLDCSLPRCPV